MFVILVFVYVLCPYYSCFHNFILLVSEFSKVNNCERFCFVGVSKPI